MRPSDGVPLRGSVRFEWQPTGPLPEGAGYELVWWNLGENPASARGLASPTRDTSLTINLDILYNSHALLANRFYWSVLIVQTTPYSRLIEPAASVWQTVLYDPGP